MVKAGILATALLAVTAGSALAQQARTPDMETIRARQKISIVEGALERAVQNGADNFGRRLRAVSPEADTMAVLLGAPVVRGFRLEERGVFFDVLMPSIQASMVWPLRYTQSSTRRDGPVSAVANLQASPAAQGPAPSAADAALLEEPAEAWRNEVRATLTDAILENTGGLAIGPDEYITLAARGVQPSDRMPDPGESRTMELKLRGSDLAAFRSGALTLEQARAKVAFREY